MEISFCFLSKIDFMRIVRHFIYYYWYFVYVVIRRDYRFTSILGIGLVFYDVDHSVFYFYAVIRKDLIMPGMPNPYTGKCDCSILQNLIYMSLSTSKINFYIVLLHENESHSSQLSWESIFHLSICSLNVIPKKRLHAGWRRDTSLLCPEIYISLLYFSFVFALLDNLASWFSLKSGLADGHHSCNNWWMSWCHH